MDLIEQRAKSRLIVGNIFDQPVPVVPILTEGRAYGSISRQAVAMGLTLPDLQLGHSVISRQKGRTFIFSCLWASESPYSEALITRIVVSAMAVASHEELEAIAFPLLGGNQGRRYLRTMLLAVEKQEDDLDELERHCPAVAFVTNNAELAK